MDGESISLEWKTRDCMFPALVICGLTVVFVEIEVVVYAGEYINIELRWIVNSTPADFGRQRAAGSCFRKDRNIFESSRDLMPLSALERLAGEEVVPVSRREPDPFDGEPSLGVGRCRNWGGDQL